MLNAFISIFVIIWVPLTVVKVFGMAIGKSKIEIKKYREKIAKLAQAKKDHVKKENTSGTKLLTKQNLDDNFFR